VAADLGGSNCKMISAAVDDSKLIFGKTLQFSNTPAYIHDNIYWDILGIYNCIVDGIGSYNREHEGIASVGIDAWGATCGFLDARDRLLEPVYHYRDLRTVGILRKMEAIVSKKELFRLSGTQCNRFYTLPQLYSEIDEQEPSLNFAKSFLFIPDLIAFFLSGVKSTEITIAGTSSLLNSEMNGWSSEIISKFHLPQNIFLNIVEPGTVKGKISRTAAERTGAKGADVISVAGHDTASAVTAIPYYDGHKAYVSVGTTIIVGNECDKIYLDDMTYNCGFKNTNGFGGKNLLYHDFTGFWLVNQLLASFKAHGKFYSYDDLNAMAGSASANYTFIDPEDGRIDNSDGSDMIENIMRICRETGQSEPISDEALIKCIFESFAMKIRHCVLSIGRITGKLLNEVVVIGGGSRNGTLDSMIAGATGIPVRAGSPYATLIGNVMSQFHALGEIGGIDEIREITGRTINMTRYEPADMERWNDKYGRAVRKGIYREVCSLTNNIANMQL
jgi:rhamnulokinase